MRIRLAFATSLAILLAAGAALAAGAVEEVTFYSEALGMDRAALVYLPEGYDTSGTEYPVVYFIQGHEGTAGNWYAVPDFVQAIDEMIGDGLVDPFILVEPDASSMPWAPALSYPFPSCLTDSELGGNHEAALVEDLVGWVDTTYRTIADRGHRYIFGRSAGGYGAARVALRHPDVFGGLGTQVGLVALEPVQYMLPMLLAEYSGGPPYAFNPVAGSVSFMVFSWSAALTPNLTNLPWMVDLVVDQDGNLDTEVWNRFVSQSPTRWAMELVAAGDELDIFMDAGAQDLFLPFTTVFASVLDGIGLPYTLQIFEGDHDTPMAERLKHHVTYFMPLNTVAESPHHFFNPRRGWPVQEFMLELPGDLEAELIAFDTIEITEINGVKLATALRPLVSHALSDVNGNGQQDLTIWFSAWGLAGAMRDVGVDVPSNVDVVVRGETTAGLFWEGTETLFVPVLGK